MDKKILIILIAVIAAVVLVGGYFILNQQNSADETTLIISDSAYMKVPVSQSATSKANKDGIFYYVDKEHGVNVTCFHSNGSKSAGLTKMNKLKNSIESGAKKSDEGNVVVYEKDGVYSIFVRNTDSNDTILIQSTDKKLLLKCWESIKYHDPSDSLKFEDSSSVVNATEETQTAISEASSSSSSGSSGSSDSGSSSDSTESTDNSPSAYDDGGGGSSDSGSGSAYSDSGSGGGGSGGGGSGGGSAYK